MFHAIGPMRFEPRAKFKSGFKLLVARRAFSSDGKERDTPSSVKSRTAEGEKGE